MLSRKVAAVASLFLAVLFLCIDLLLSVCACSYGYVSFFTKEAADLAISTFDDQLQLQVGALVRAKGSMAAGRLS